MSERPERLSERLPLRIASALSLARGPILPATLERRPDDRPAAIEPILMEAERAGEAAPDPRRPGRPRRRSVLRPGLTVRAR